MKHRVIAEAEAVGRKIEHAFQGRSYSVLGFLFCAVLLLGVAFSRSKAAEAVADALT